MNLITRPSTSLPSLLSDFFTPSPFFERGLFDVEPETFPARLGVNIPSVNLAETKKEFVVELAAPGLEKKDFTIELENHMLTIAVQKEEETTEEDGYYKKEYSYRSFSRSFSMPENVLEEKIEARYDKGILKVTIPKVKETEPQGEGAKKISVN